MSNRVTLNQLRTMPLSEAQTIPLDQLQMLQEDIDETESQIKFDKALIQTVLDNRFGMEANAIRLRAGKDTGSVSVRAGEFNIQAELSKVIKWEQSFLAKAAETIVGWGSNPDDYMKVERKVSEAAYNAWPPEIRAIFTPARTVTAGKPKYTIVTKEGK